MKKITSCNYCRKPQSWEFSYRGYLVTARRILQPILHVRACSEHVGCVNWVSVLASAIERGTLLIAPREVN